MSLGTSEVLRRLAAASARSTGCRAASASLASAHWALPAALYCWPGATAWCWRWRREPCMLLLVTLLFTVRALSMGPGTLGGPRAQLCAVRAAHRAQRPPRPLCTRAGVTPPEPSVVALVTWPTAVTPARNLGLAVGNGPEIANAQPIQTVPSTHRERRFPFEHLPSDRIAAYIRNNTTVDARVFSPHRHQLTYSTGRPNASGFAGLVHLNWRDGPEYRDVLEYLEPAAVRRLGFEYVHAPDEWVESLPAEAAARLDDPNLFQLLVRDDSESLYRVLPAFLALDTPPASCVLRGSAASRARVRGGVSARIIRLAATRSAWRRCSPMPGCSALYIRRRLICARHGRPSRSATTCPTSSSLWPSSHPGRFRPLYGSLYGRTARPPFTPSTAPSPRSFRHRREPSRFRSAFRVSDLRAAGLERRGLQPRPSTTVRPTSGQARTG